MKSKHIEFQLDGGGYGTMGDETSTNISTGATPKTRRERNLEAEVKRETDPVKKRAIREELDDLKRERGLPRKGMLAQEVDAHLGPPTTSKERKEGTLKVQTREYSTPEGRFTADFVEGVLIRYTVTSE